MKTLFLAFGLALFVGDAHAISRYNAGGMQCAEIQDRIAEEGAAVMRYRSVRTGAPLYGRYVRDGNFCPSSTRPEFRSIPAADTDQCRVKECQNFDLGDDVFLFER